jgi:hypothetical protein
MDGRKFDWIRKQLGLSKAELGRRLGISRQSLYRCIWEGPPKLVALAILGLWYQDRMGGCTQAGKASRTASACSQLACGLSPASATSDMTCHVENSVRHDGWINQRFRTDRSVGLRYAFRDPHGHFGRRISNVNLVTGDVVLPAIE